MNTAGKLSAYGLALALLAVGGWAGGVAVGPVSTSEPASDGHSDGPSNGPSNGHGESHGGTVAEGHRDDGHDSHEPEGLASSRNGYTLAVADTTLTEGETQPFTFRIIGPDGDAVTRFDLEHERRMHLILVRRDAEGFQHLHPKLAPDGEWTVPLRLDEAGSYRAYADFTPTGGEPLTLGADLAVPGDFQPVSHEPSRVARVGDYRVRLDGEIVPGESTTLTATVTKHGRPVRDLRPYLGAYGHLVALRTGDLGYLHVHPEGAPGDDDGRSGPTIAFRIEAPSQDDYRLFLDFRHDGEVRTADFTIASGAAGRHTGGSGGGESDAGQDSGHDAESGQEHGHG